MKLEKVRKTSKFKTKSSAQSPSQNKNLADSSKKLLKNRNETFPAFCNFTWKLEFFANILLIIVDSPFHQASLICSKSDHFRPH